MSILKYEVERLKQKARRKAHTLRVSITNITRNFLLDVRPPHQLRTYTYGVERELYRLRDTIEEASQRQPKGHLQRTLVRIVPHTPPGSPKTEELLDLNSIVSAEIIYSSTPQLELVTHDNHAHRFSGPEALRLYDLLTHPSAGRTGYVVEISHD